VCVLSACASTTLGRAIQAAEIERQVVVRASVEAVKLHLHGQLTDAQLTTVKTGYQAWETAQRGLADALARWRVIEDGPNEARLQRALEQAGRAVETYLALLATLKVNIAEVRAAVAAGR
jgi:hypothetical protein